MTSDAPGPGTPGSGGPTDDETQAVPAAEWPAELVPPPPGAQPEAPSSDVRPAPEAPAAGGPPEPAAALASAAPPPASPVAPADPPQWGAPAAPQPAPPQWGAPAPAGSAPPPAEPQWDAPTAPVPQPAPAVPPPPGAWGAAGAPGQPPAQPGQWGAPPAQPGGWAPPPGAAGGPPSGAWNPQPAQSGNGCLKACLIVGGILVVVGIIGVIGLSFLGAQIASDLGVNPDGSVKACELIDNEELSAVLGSPTEALPMGGFVDDTIGMVLDRRILPDATDCWILGTDEAATTGRIARQDGDASATFAAASQQAQEEGYFAGSLSGYGNEAFCTALGDTGSFGVLVRAGDSLAYVSLVSPPAMEGDGVIIDEQGAVTSPAMCDLGARVAVEILR